MRAPMLLARASCVSTIGAPLVGVLGAPLVFGVATFPAVEFRLLSAMLVVAEEALCVRISSVLPQIRNNSNGAPSSSGLSTHEDRSNCSLNEAGKSDKKRREGNQGRPAGGGGANNRRSVCMAEVPEFWQHLQFAERRSGHNLAFEGQI